MVGFLYAKNMKKEELKQNTWYRFLQVMYGFLFFATFFGVLFMVHEASKPYKYVSFNKSYIECPKLDEKFFLPENGFNAEDTDQYDHLTDSGIWKAVKICVSPKDPYWLSHMPLPSLDIEQRNKYLEEKFPTTPMTNKLALFEQQGGNLEDVGIPWEEIYKEQSWIEGPKLVKGFDYIGITSYLKNMILIAFGIFFVFLVVRRLGLYVLVGKN